MDRRCFVLGATAALMGCEPTTAPVRPEDACAIFHERGSWWWSARRAERRWGAPPALQLAIIHQESAFVRDASPPARRILFILPGPPVSTAHGYAQALESTWEEYERAAGDRGVDPSLFRDAADFVAWYASVSHRELSLDYADGRSHYLAYHEGRAGFRSGSYRGDDRLLASAARVQRLQDRYQRQLDQCSRDLGRWRLPF